jgi:hypothetical protein
VSNTTFWDNGASGLGGGVLCDGSEPLLTNTSFSQNSAAAGGALYSLGSAHPRLINSVLWGDAPDELDQSASASVTARYCDVQGGCTVSGGCTTDETGNLDVDPLYLDPTEGDLRLWMESPVVDQGDNTAAVAFPLDREGDTRILDGDDDSQAVVDLGADEVRYSPATMPVIYVDPAATGANDGTSWADAYTDLRAAFAAAPAFHQIWVAEGTYAPSDLGDVTESFVLPAGVVLFGGFAPDQGIVVMALRDPTAYPAVLTGDIMGDDALGNTTNNAYHTVTSGNYAVLDGFTLTAGYNNANTSYGDGKGACLDIREGHHFWLRNSRVHGCIANLGGAVHARPGSHAVIEGCVFEDNEALQGSGGAVRLQEPGSGTTLSGCTFDGNHAGYMGGGLSVYSGSGVRVTGCTFTGNSTGGNYAGWGGGGAYFEIADNVLVETTGFSGNTASAGGGAVFKDCSGVVVQSSTFDANQVSSSVTSLPCDVSHRFMEAVGGGAYVEGTDLIVAGSTFSSNTAIHSGSTPCNDPSNRYFFGVGGGIFTRESAVDVLDTTFLANQAKVNGAACLGGAGAGIGSYDADLRVVNTTFRNNAAFAGSIGLNTCTGGGGGGLWTYHDWDPGDHLSNCVFVGNTATDGGSGLRLEYSLTRMYGLTVTGNSGSFWGSGAMLGQGTAYVYNSIFWGNTGTSTYQTQFALGPGGGGCYGSRRAYTYYTLIADTLSGDGCLDACTGSYGACVHPRDFDPGFVNAGANPPDLTLQAGANAVNSGSNNAAHQADDWLDADGDGNTSEDIPVDRDGNPRRNGNMDLGAYERP